MTVLFYHLIVIYSLVYKESSNSYFYSLMSRRVFRIFKEVKNINKDTAISLNKEDSLILRNFLNENLADEL